ncbi:MAG: hypothetical protein P8Y70_00005 [Candidatus Lokiarchaeota archaeon]
MKKVTTHRQVIRNLINRKKHFSITTYIRKIRKVTGKVFTPANVVSALCHMQRENQLRYSFTKTERGTCYVVGFCV